MSLFPPFEQLRLSQKDRKVLQTLLTGRITKDILSRRVRLPPFGGPTLGELLAVYAPKKVLLHPRLVAYLTGSFSWLGHSLGEKWKGIRVPSDSFACLNTDPEAAVELFGNPLHHEFRTERTNPNTKENTTYFVSYGVESVLHYLHYGNKPPRKFATEIRDRQIALMTALVSRSNVNTQTGITLLDFLLPHHSDFATPQPNSVLVEWCPRPLHHDRRLVPLYPQIRDTFLPILNTLEPNSRQEIGRWLQGLAQDFIQEKSHALKRGHTHE